LTTGMETSWWDSSATFRRCTEEKASFILLCLFDLTLTILAVNLGLTELNPFVRFLIQIPVLLLVIKLAIPILIAWLMPGRLLWPSIGLLALIVVWNIKELVIFLL
jgi:fumarate reductase subunit C